MTELLNTRDAARLIGTSEASIRRWSDAGLLPVQRIGRRRERRFRADDLRRFVAEGWRPASGEQARPVTVPVGRAEVALGSHLATFYASADGLGRVAGPFLGGGASAGQPTFLMAGDDVRGDYLAAAGGGAGVTVVGTQGRSPQEVAATWEGLLWSSAASRAEAIRVVIDVASARRDFRSERDWRETEAALDPLLRRSPAVLICQFDVRRLSGELVLEALKIHPDLFAHRLADFLT